MQIALTLQELAQILEAHWGIEVQPENLTLAPDAGEIVIRDASFQMLIQGANKSKVAPAPKTPQPVVAPLKEIVPEPAPAEDTDDDNFEEEENTPMTMEDILNISKTAMLNKKVLTHPEITRALRAYETEDPPEMDEAELAANRR